ncbi:MAG: 16S rRNA (cytidine(1402)-2'-O)-methyltransferase [Pyrinomonadaceae bacterium]|nr:16S rRNA (cytidine(1402)-2'-O)-methyltransferase [Pyrinomonadaceae bacterium]
MTGTLYLVATPIGNLGDITYRAVEILRTVDLIACEDTRRSGILLKHLNIKNRLISYHEHNELQRSEELIKLIQSGRSVAIISDAGTPGISDPSFRIIEKAHEIGASVIPIPGAVAFVCAAVVSGLPTDSIFFGGFLPSRKGERRKRLAEISNIPATILFYEAPHRVGKSLLDCFEILGNRKCAVVRELTKIHEEIIRGDLETLSARFAKEKLRGEIVLVIARSTTGAKILPGSLSLPERVNELESENIDRKSALKIAAKEFGLSKSEAYRQMVSYKK